MLFTTSFTCKLTTSSLVAGVLDTCCTHNCPFSVHSLFKTIYSRPSYELEGFADEMYTQINIMIGNTIAY